MTARSGTGGRPVRAVRGGISGAMHRHSASGMSANFASIRPQNHTRESLRIFQPIFFFTLAPLASWRLIFLVFDSVLAASFRSGS